MHSSATGWPIVGDNIYGNGPRFGEPTVLHLHSREIVIPISKNKEPVRVVAPAPEHMRERLRRAGGTGSDARACISRSMPEHIRGADDPVFQSVGLVRDLGVLRSPGQAGREELWLTPSTAHHHGPLIASAITAPGVSPDIATGRKCSVRPCVALSIST